MLDRVFGKPKQTAAQARGRTGSLVLPSLSRRHSAVKACNPSIGTALLNTLAASATTAYLVARPHTASVAAHAAVHGYTTAFWWSAGIYFAGAILVALVLKPGVQQIGLNPEPALTH